MNPPPLKPDFRQFGGAVAIAVLLWMTIVQIARPLLSRPS